MKGTTSVGSLNMTAHQSKRKCARGIVMKQTLREG